MITIAKFTQQFFIELFKNIKVHTTLFVCEDGNVYATEKGAKARSESKEYIASINKEKERILRYIRVDLASWPFSPHDFEYNIQKIADLFNDSEAVIREKKRREEAENIVVQPISEEQALAEMAEYFNGANPNPTGIKVGEVEYPLDDIIDALRASVLPKFSVRTGIEKTKTAIEALTEDEKIAFEAALVKE